MNRTNCQAIVTAWCLSRLIRSLSVFGIYCGLWVWQTLCWSWSQ